MNVPTDTIPWYHRSAMWNSTRFYSATKRCQAAPSLGPCKMPVLVSRTDNEEVIFCHSLICKLLHQVHCICRVRLIILVLLAWIWQTRQLGHMALAVVDYVGQRHHYTTLNWARYNGQLPKQYKWQHGWCQVKTLDNIADCKVPKQRLLFYLYGVRMYKSLIIINFILTPSNPRCTYM